MAGSRRGLSPHETAGLPKLLHNRCLKHSQATLSFRKLWGTSNLSYAFPGLAKLYVCVYVTHVHICVYIHDIPRCVGVRFNSKGLDVHIRQLSLSLSPGASRYAAEVSMFPE